MDEEKIFSDTGEETDGIREKDAEIIFDESDDDDEKGAADLMSDEDEEVRVYDGDSDDACYNEPVPKKKKRKKCCLITVIVALVTVVVFVASIFTAAYVAWDKLLGESTQMNLFEGMGVLSNLYKADSSVVTNPYGDEDLDSFYDGLLNAMCMSVPDDFDLNLPGIVTGFINKGGQESGMTAGEYVSAAFASAGVSYGDSKDITSETTGNKDLDDLLRALKFDWELLRNVDDSTGLLELNGKELAAFVNEVLQYAFVNVESLAQMQQEWNVDFSQIITLEQIEISGTDVINDASTSARATIRIRLRDMLKSAAQKLDGIVAFAVKTGAGLLPKEIYITAEIYPCVSGGQAKIIINSTDEENMLKLLSIVDGVLALTGSESRTSALLSSINETIYTSIQSVSSIVAVNFVSDNVNAKPIDTVINTMGLNLSGKEFFEIVRYIAAPDHYMSDSDGDGYADGFDYIDYTHGADELVASFEKYYGVVQDELDENGNKIPGNFYIDTDNIYTSLKQMFAGEGAVTDHISFGNVAADPEVTCESTVPVTYNSMGGLIRSYMSSEDAGEQLKKYYFELLSISYDELRSKPDENIHYLNVKFKLDIRESLKLSNPELFNENGVFYNIVSQMLPSALYLVADMEISAMTSAEGMEVSLQFNDCGEDTQSVMESMYKLLIGLKLPEESAANFRYDKICEILSTTMQDVVGKDIGKYVIGYNSDGFLLDNVYSLMYNIVYEDKLNGTQPADKVEKKDFENAVRNIYLLDGKIADGDYNPDEISFISSEVYLGKNFTGDGNDNIEFDWTNIITTRTMSITDKKLGNVLISREKKIREEAGGDPEAQQAQDIGTSLGLKSGARYGEDYWLEQIAFLNSSEASRAVYEACNSGAEGGLPSLSIKDTYNAYLADNGMPAKDTPEGLLVVTATISSSALDVGSNAAFRLLPESVSVTIIMDMTVNNNADPDDNYPVTVFVNDMNMDDMQTLKAVMSVDENAAPFAEKIFGDSLRINVRKFLLEFAVHKKEEGSLYDKDVSMEDILACSGIEAVSDSDNGGIGKCVVDLVKLAAKLGISVTPIP